MNSNNNSVSYASGKDLGLIRTNLNNIDYATNNTIYRRPQLHNPSIYERSSNVMPVAEALIQQAAAQANLNVSRVSNQRTNLSTNNNSILSNRSNGGSVQGLPPPPPMIFNANTQFAQSNFNNQDPSDILENEIFGADYLDRVLNLEDNVSIM